MGSILIQNDLGGKESCARFKCQRRRDSSGQMKPSSPISLKNTTLLASRFMVKRRSAEQGKLERDGRRAARPRQDFNARWPVPFSIAKPPDEYSLVGPCAKYTRFEAVTPMTPNGRRSRCPRFHHPFPRNSHLQSIRP